MLLTIFFYLSKKLTYKKVLFGIIGIVLIIVFTLSSIWSRFQEATVYNVSRVKRLGAISYFWTDFVEDFNSITLVFGPGKEQQQILCLIYLLFLIIFLQQIMNVTSNL